MRLDKETAATTDRGALSVWRTRTAQRGRWDLFVFCVCYSRRRGFRILYLNFFFKEVRIFLYFVFCMSSSYWRKLRIFSYFAFLIQGGEDLLYFVFVFPFQGHEDLFVFCICICYPRMSEESFSEFCTIIKFQLVYGHFQSCRNYSCVRDSECSFDSDCFGAQVGGYQLSHGRLSHAGYHIVVITWPVITRS